MFEGSDSWFVNAPDKYFNEYKPQLMWEPEGLMNYYDRVKPLAKKIEKAFREGNETVQEELLEQLASRGGGTAELSRRKGKLTGSDLHDMMFRMVQEEILADLDAGLPVSEELAEFTEFDKSGRAPNFPKLRKAIEGK